MREPEKADEAWTFERRSALKLTAGLVASGTFVGSAVADHGGSDGTETVTTYKVKQGGETYEIEPLSGDEPVRELYDYRLPDYQEGVGATDADTGPYWQSAGTQDLQRNATSILFLYDGPDGLSLVVVHDAIDGSGGGTVTWEVADVPADAEWIVMDDYYEDAETGEKADSNYDRWDTDGTDHTIDWTWAEERNDGGVLGYLEGEFSFVVHPAFNEAAALYDADHAEHGDGKIEAWEVLTGDLNSPERITLDLDEAVTLSCTTETVEDGDDRDERDDWDDGDDKDNKDDGDDDWDDEDDWNDGVDEPDGGEEPDDEDEDENERDDEDDEEKSEAEKKHEEIAERIKRAVGKKDDDEDDD